MKKRFMKFMAVMMVLCFTIVFMTPVQSKAGTKVYFSSLSGSKSFGYYGNIKTIQVKGNSIVIKGSFTQYSSEKSFDQNRGGKKIGYKKRTFKLSKNVKFYSAGGEDSKGRIIKEKISKDSFKKTAERLIGLDLELDVKNGKVVKALLWS